MCSSPEGRVVTTTLKNRLRELHECVLVQSADEELRDLQDPPRTVEQVLPAASCHSSGLQHLAEAKQAGTPMFRC